MHDRIRRLTFFIAAISSAGAAVFPLGAQQPAAASCRISGRVTNGTTALPGVALIAYAGETVAAATSTEIDGTYQLAVAPGAYRLKAELTGFTTIEQSVALGGEPCAQSTNVQLALTPRSARSATPHAGGARRTRARFETLNVQSQDAGAVAQTIAPEREAAEAATRLLLPPGFSTDAPTESLAVSGNMASIDRGMIGERLDAIMRGEFNPTTGEFGQGFGPAGPGGPGGRGGQADQAGKAARGDAAKGAAALVASAGATSSSAAAADGRTPTTSRRTTPTADPRSTVGRTGCATTRTTPRFPITVRDSASLLAARCESPASTTVSAGRRSRQPTTAIAAISSSSSTAQCLPLRCAPGISRRSAGRSSIP